MGPFYLPLNRPLSSDRILGSYPTTRQNTALDRLRQPFTVGAAPRGCPASIAQEILMALSSS